MCNDCFLSQQPASAAEADFEALVLQKLRNAGRLKRPVQESTEEQGSAEQATVQDPFRSSVSVAESEGSVDEDGTQLPRGASSRSGGTERRRTPDIGTCGNSQQESRSFVTSAGPEAKDYESLVSMRMRQVGERQRLIEQMAREDAEDS